jgi:hypothetical protein
LEVVYVKRVGGISISTVGFSVMGCRLSLELLTLLILFTIGVVRSKLTTGGGKEVGAEADATVGSGRTRSSDG